MSSTSLDEELIDHYVQDGNIEMAVKLLYDLIVKHAKQKDFAKAEAFRQKLFEVDPMALTEIIKSAEIIEEEKHVSIDVSHKELWAKLYDRLTTEEVNILYYALKEAAFDPDQQVFRQGQLNPKLYLINRGELKLTCQDQDREALLGTLTAGDIIGDDSFFINSVCSTSLATISSVKLHYLEKEVLAQWEHENPLLVSKLQDFCNAFSKSHELIQRYHGDRRTQKRVSATGRCQIQIINSSGEPVGRPFYGDLSDLSRGGLSFFVRISKKETARMLLGRRIRVVFDAVVGSADQTIERDGTIVAIRDRAFTDCSVHVKFRSLMSVEFLEGQE